MRHLFRVVIGWLSLATREGFYFGACEAIKQDHGLIAPLHEQ